MHTPQDNSNTLSTRCTTSSYDSTARRVPTHAVLGYRVSKEVLHALPLRVCDLLSRTLMWRIIGYNKWYCCYWKSVASIRLGHIVGYNNSCQLEFVVVMLVGSSCVQFLAIAVGYWSSARAPAWVDGCVRQWYPHGQDWFKPPSPTMGVPCNRTVDSNSLPPRLSNFLKLTFMQCNEDRCHAIYVIEPSCILWQFFLEAFIPSYRKWSEVAFLSGHSLGTITFAWLGAGHVKLCLWMSSLAQCAGGKIGTPLAMLPAAYMCLVSSRARAYRSSCSCKCIWGVEVAQKQWNLNYTVCLLRC